MPTETGKQNSGQVRPITLPKHMKLSEAEMVMVSRLVRVHRDQTYWLGAFIEWLLDHDASLKPGFIIDVKFAVQMLESLVETRDKFGPFFTDEGNQAILRYIGRKYFNPYISAPPEDEQEDDDNRESGEFLELVKLWRKDHPEPPKRRRIPAGHLGQEESGD